MFEAAIEAADAGDDTVGGMRWIPGGGCLCFTEETLVHAEEGPKTIGEIEIGDYVWSLNEETGETALAVVAGKYKRVTSLVWQIEIAGRAVQATEAT